MRGEGGEREAGQMERRDDGREEVTKGRRVSPLRENLMETEDILVRRKTLQRSDLVDGCHWHSILSVSDQNLLDLETNETCCPSAFSCFNPLPFPLDKGGLGSKIPRTWCCV